MARINTNVSSMIAQHNLQRSNSDLQVAMQRLSTGLRINRGADGPADLIVSERLRSEIEGIGQAIDNAERATNVIATGEAALAEVANLLTSIKALVVEAANTGGLSQEEIEANQLQIDDAIASIDRIAATTSFAGLNLLNGSLDYITSGVPASAISDVNIHGASFGTNSNLPVSVEVVTSAERGGLYLSTGAATLTSSVTMEIAGDEGAEIFQFVSGTNLSAVLFAVNRVSDSTGVVASMAGATFGSGLIFRTAEFGSDSFVSVEKVPGTTGGDFLTTYTQRGVAGSAARRDTGVDVLALVNGNLALGDGTRVSLNSSALDVEMRLSDAFAQTAATRNFTITGGGATYQLGPVVETTQQISFGIRSIAAGHLGTAADGFLSSIVSGGSSSLVAGKSREASEIIEEAITQVAVLRGRLGAFERNTLQTNIQSLQIALENVTASESQIRDADFARETSKLTRAQLLTNVGTSVLSTANNNAGNVLQLLQ